MPEYEDYEDDPSKPVSALVISNSTNPETTFLGVIKNESEDNNFIIPSSKEKQVSEPICLDAKKPELLGQYKIADNISEEPKIDIAISIPKIATLKYKVYGVDFQEDFILVSSPLNSIMLEIEASAPLTFSMLNDKSDEVDVYLIGKLNLNKLITDFKNKNIEITLFFKSKN